MELAYELTQDHPTQLGMVVLQSDETLEKDMRQLLPKNVELLVSRVSSGTELDTKMIAGMEGRLTDAASLLPRGAKLAAIGYGCTSASAQIGPARVAERIRAGAATDHVTDPVTSLIAACRQLDISRIGLISPYVEVISARMCEVVEDAGIKVVSFGSFNEPTETNVVRISPKSLHGAAVKIAQDKACEAVFLSCTNLRTLDVIEDIEREIGLPILSSNPVLAWNMLRLAGVETPASIPGTLGKARP